MVNKPPLVVLLLALLIAVVLALIFGVQLLGVVSGLVFPPDPPLPQGSTELSSQNLAHGLDEWTYRTTRSPCAVAAFYADMGGDCQFSEAYCETGLFDSPGRSVPEVATCTGSETVSIFGMQWRAMIYTRIIYGEEGTYVDLRREMLWNGPPPTIPLE